MGTVKLAVAKELCNWSIYLNRVIVLSMIIKMYQYKSHSDNHVSNASTSIVEKFKVNKSQLNKSNSDNDALKRRRESAAEQRAEASSRLRNCCPQTSPRTPARTTIQNITNKQCIANHRDVNKILMVQIIRINLRFGDLRRRRRDRSK